MDKVKISSLQMAFLIYFTIVSTGILFVPGSTGSYAKQDMWLSPVWSALSGIITVLVVWKLDNLYPKQTIIQYSQQILGRIPGKILGCFYLLFILIISGNALREYEEVIIDSFLPRTPMIVVMGSLMFVISFAIKGGVEVLGRLSQLFIPIFILPLVIIPILSLQDLDPKNLFPMFKHGAVPSLMGAIGPAGWFSEFFFISYLMPFLSDREKGLKWSLIAVAAITITFISMNFLLLFLYGDAVGSLVFPVLIASKFISIADFLERLDIFVLAIWVIGLFLKLSVYFFGLIQCMVQLLNLPDYRPQVFPIAFIIMWFGVWGTPNSQGLAYYLRYISPFFLTSLDILIPILLLSLALIRKRRKEEPSG